MLLYANGCSHVAGEEIDGDGLGNNYDLAYSSILAKRLGYDYHNDAVTGGSNDRIVRTTIDFVENFKRSHNNDTTSLFAVIGWSGIDRIEVLYDKEFYNLCAGMWKNSGWKYIPTDVRDLFKLHNIVNSDYHYMTTKLINQIILLKHYLKSHQIPFIFINSFNKFQFVRDDDKTSILFDTIKADLFHETPECSNYESYLRSKGFKPRQQMHFDASAHEHYASILYDSIKMKTS